MSFKPYPFEKFPLPLKGIVSKTITANIPGRIRFQGTFWPAHLYQGGRLTTLYPNSPVSVIGRQGIALLVKSET
ncbi:MAG: NfeD family protein [Cyanobacteria bacterium SID2]|nr:NfeD family protein [Cyanobacteria bacterium SID2]MBP0003169.1 NfeD family protein [Cyanobacteria bacterium SBC]